MVSKLVRRQEEAPGIWSYFFSKPAGFTFEAGDYTEIELVYPEGGGDRRWFTIASAPYETQLQVTFKLPKPHSAFKGHLIELQTGSEVHLAPPMGNFNLPIRTDKLLFVAGGIGITPFRSMLLQAKHDALTHDIELIYAAKPNEYLFIEGVQKLTDVHRINEARLKPTQLSSIVADADERIIYLAGPEGMMELFFDELLALGHPRPRLKLCYFENYTKL